MVLRYALELRTGPCATGVGISRTFGLHFSPPSRPRSPAAITDFPWLLPSTPVLKQITTNRRGLKAQPSSWQPSCWASRSIATTPVLQKIPRNWAFQSGRVKVHRHMQLG